MRTRVWHLRLWRELFVPWMAFFSRPWQTCLGRPRCHVSAKTRCEFVHRAGFSPHVGQNRQSCCEDSCKDQDSVRDDCRYEIDAISAIAQVLHIRGETPDQKCRHPISNQLCVTSGLTPVTHNRRLDTAAHGTSLFLQCIWRRQITATSTTTRHTSRQTPTAVTVSHRGACFIVSATFAFLI